MCVYHHINPKQISLIGFDSLLSGLSGGGNDWAGEKRILESLDMEVIDLGKAD